MGDNEGSISAFNEGALQMRRLDELQAKINMLNMNPLKYDVEAGLYHYQVIFNCICSLFKEASSKLSDKEREEGDQLRKKIKESIRINKIHYNTKDGRGTKINVFATENWNLLEEMLYQFEVKVRIFLEKHDLTAPKGEDPRKAALG